MAQQSVHAVVDRKGYVYRGQGIPKGRVVKMSAAQFEETQTIIPSYFRKAKAEEVERADVILDLATVEPAHADRVAAAEAAEAEGGSAKGKAK